MIHCDVQVPIEEVKEAVLRGEKIPIHTECHMHGLRSTAVASVEATVGKGQLR